MAQATSTPATPKQMGNHLRAVRRRKGLSLSEVARGAGLNRRELVNYERGKTAIPESDLWVLAGSIGVDVSELVPPAPSTNLPVLRTDPGAESVTDAVASLRRATEHEEASPHLGALRVLQQLPVGKRIPVKDRELAAIAADLGGEPGAIELNLQQILGVDPLEAARLRAMLLEPASGRHRKAKALGAAEVAPAARYSAPIVPLPAPTEPAPTEHEAVDVFEELARLPEPLPLPDASSMPDLLSTPPAEANAVELVDGTFPTLGSGFGFNLQQPAMAESTAAATTGALPTTVHSGADAPPIDVTPRPADDWGWVEPTPGTPLTQRPSPADDDLATAGGGDWPVPDAPLGDVTPPWEPPAVPTTDGITSFWESTDDWTPDDVAAQDPTDAELAAADPNALWSFEPTTVDPWSAVAATNHTGIDEPSTLTDDPVVAELIDSPWITPTTDDAPPHEPGTFGPWDHDLDPAAASSGFIVDWGEAPDATSDDDPVPGQWAGPGTWDEPLTPAWEVHSDGTAIDDAPVEDDDTVDAYDAFDAYDTFAADPFASTTDVETETVETVEAHVDAPAVDGSEFSFGSDLAATLAATYLPDAPVEAPVDAEFDVEPEHHGVDAPTEPEPEPEPQFGAPHTTELPRIVWRADAFGNVDTVPPADTEIDTEIHTGEDTDFDIPTGGPVDEDAAERTPVFASAPASFAPVAFTEPEPEPAAEPDFVTAGADWLLGNAVPLVEVQAAGALVMRRADERWALADVSTADDFVLEVDLDFRSGPGLGVLFRASVDHDGAMSGYSFDVDPIYDGGGYLVRQWQHDRELWNPIARIKADDPNTMYGKLTIRLEVRGNTLEARVNGAEVLRVDDLEQASRERDRDAAVGDRVGVQAWSSSDLVIDTLRVANH
jgi:transcriptional regulator with XRE-family HTH domain